MDLTLNQVRMSEFYSGLPTKGHETRDDLDTFDLFKEMLYIQTYYEIILRKGGGRGI